MANLTITVDDDTLKRARIRAIERGQSVNAFLADQLRKYAEDDAELLRQQRAAEDVVELSKHLTGGSGGVGWTREDLYEERRIS